MTALQFPLTRITFFFITGLLIAYYSKLDIQITFILLGLMVIILSCVFYYLRSGINNNHKITFGLIAYSFSFVIGICTQTVHNDYLQLHNYMHYIHTDKPQWLQVSIIEKLKSSTYKDRYIVVVKKLDGRVTNGKLLLHIQKDSLHRYRLEPGLNLLIWGTIIKHKPPYNPDQFDYGHYLLHKSVMAQLYADKSSIKVGTSYDKNIWYYSACLRNNILNNLKRHTMRNEELNVAAALILGQQQDISAEILHDYQFAGAVHVLSVSGLHVGYILLFINFILSGLPKNKSGNLIRLSSVLLTLWAFAIIAGLSPSIVRSVTMFSFVATGMYLKRETYIFHTLIVSILLILMVAPSFLFDIGFQLSYISLFFILWLQPMFAAIWLPKNIITKYLWDIITVSFAAQIGAFPLSIYYFHQFPGLFFITNIIILPGLGIIMALGVFVMIMAALDFVPSLPLTILEWLIYILNSVIDHIASFEQFIIQDIPLSVSMLISLYLAIIAVIIWFEKPTFRRLVFALSLILSFQISNISTIWLNQKNNEFIVFHSIKKSIFTKRIGQRLIVYSNNSVLKTIDHNPVLKSYLIANFSHISTKKTIPNTEYIKGIKILIIDSTAICPSLSKPDILILIQSPKINLARLLSYYHPRTVIADGSNYKTYVALWKATCIKRKIPFHATAEKGFYKLK